MQNGGRKNGRHRPLARAVNKTITLHSKRRPVLPWLYACTLAIVAEPYAGSETRLLGNTASERGLDFLSQQCDWRRVFQVCVLHPMISSDPTCLAKPYDEIAYITVEYRAVLLSSTVQRMKTHFANRSPLILFDSIISPSHYSRGVFI